MKSGIKAVVVLSGGQDSTTGLASAVKKHGAAQIAAITFRYGQRHELETRYARAAARHFGVTRHQIVVLDFYRHLTTNALLDSKMKIEKKRGAKCPTTFVDGRNMFFLLAAAVFAKGLGARELWTGVSMADFSGYPDCREAFIRSCERSLRLAMAWPFRIVTPMMRVTKEQEWALADRLGILAYIERHTLTCYNGIPGAGCGHCPACRLRARGLAAYLAKRRGK